MTQPDLIAWYRDCGPDVPVLDYDLCPDSCIVAFGAYTGHWAGRMIHKYNPYVFLVEPIPAFYAELSARFAGIDKIKMMNCGVSADIPKTVKMSQDRDASSFVIPTTTPTVDVRLLPVYDILDRFGITSADILQINIEGYEYDLLESMLKSKIVTNFTNIQVQFHQGIPECESRRKNIQTGLEGLGYRKRYDYPFIWEAWTLNQ